MPWLARLLAIGAVVETVAGLGLLLDPAGGAALLGAVMAGPGLAIGRLAGGALLALGIACWNARLTPAVPASRGVGWAYLAYNVLTCVTLAWAGDGVAAPPLPALAASLLHGLIGAALLAALLAQGRPSGVT